MRASTAATLRQLAHPRNPWYARLVSRADRRRTERRAAAHTMASDPVSSDPVATPARQRDPWALVPRAGFVVVTLVFLYSTARMIEAKITWYLAVDQFGYLQFAHDLLQGKVLHDWEPARALGRLMPSPTDVLAQTYVFDDGRMWCRYAPGFPMLLAGWLAAFGDMGAHYLNPTIYILFLAIVIAFTWRLTASAWRGLIVTTLMVGCPTMMYLWALTLTRDLSAHLFAFSGLFLLLRHRGHRLGARRVLLASVLLGFAGSIRNDAILYLIPAAMIVASQWWREGPAPAAMLRPIGAAVLGVTIGLLPTFGLNVVATGNPFLPTQGMELQQLLTSTPPATSDGPRIGYPSPGWRGTTVAQVHGGGLRLENIPKTLPAYWAGLRSSYGPVLLGLAGLGTVVALVTRPLLVLVALPYVGAAFLLYSGWIRPDRRYFIGVYTFIPLLVSEGVCGPVDLVRWLARRFGDGPARGTAVVLALVGLAVAIWVSPAVTGPSPDTANSVLRVLGWVLPLAGGLGAMAAALSPRQRVTAVMTPLLAAVLVGYSVARVAASGEARSGFQKSQMLRARQTIQNTFEPRSVVITTEEIGRPAENLEHYAGVYALYVTDLERWHVPAWKAALAFLYAGLRPYILIQATAPERDGMLADLRANGMIAERVQTIPPALNMDYFVAAPFHRGLPLELYRVSYPIAEKIMRDEPSTRPGMGRPAP
ncbi:MAG: hypothetical protein ACREQL_04310 [Candidatus Binatia bacterium]